MIILATDYEKSRPQTYRIVINGGQISENSFEVFDELDQKIDANVVSLTFNNSDESLTIKLSHNGSIKVLSAIAVIKNQQES